MLCTLHLHNVLSILSQFFEKEEKTFCWVWSFNDRQERREPAVEQGCSASFRYFHFPWDSSQLLSLLLLTVLLLSLSNSSSCWQAFLHAIYWEYSDEGRSESVSNETYFLVDTLQIKAEVECIRRGHEGRLLWEGDINADTWMMNKSHLLAGHSVSGECKDLKVVLLHLGGRNKAQGVGERMARDNVRGWSIMPGFRGQDNECEFASKAKTELESPSGLVS